MATSFASSSRVEVVRAVAAVVVASAAASASAVAAVAVAAAIAVAAADSAAIAVDVAEDVVVLAAATELETRVVRITDVSSPAFHHRVWTVVSIAV